MIICFDLETTGLDKYNDDIIEIALVKFNENTFEIIDTLSTFINPKREIPEVISNITNIFDKDVEFAPFLEDVKNEIEEFIGDLPLLGHNVFFDRDFFIQNNIDVKNNIVLDTFFLANFLNFENSSLNLELLCRDYKIPFSGAHRALNDVHATINLFQKLLNTFNKLSVVKKELVYFIFNNTKDLNVCFLKNLLYKDVSVTDLTKEQFEAKLLKKIVKIDTEDKSIGKNSKIDTKKTKELFKNIKGLEIRENQEKMMSKVLSNLEKKEKLVIEAPTGLGKSFAYLLPSILFSLKTGQKVFISTNTKTLQDQLFYKDLNFLDENIDFPFAYTKIKGKKNYLSVKGFFEEIYSGDFIYEKVTFLNKITLWLFKTDFGELDELNYYGKEYSFLKTINGEFLFDQEKQTKYNKYEFLFKARYAVNNSNIIIINNSLLFSDLKQNNTILGKIKNLIIDEAHTIEDSITDSLRKKLTVSAIEDLFGKIEAILTKNNVKKIDFVNKSESLLNNLVLIFDYAYSYLNNKNPENNYYKNCLIGNDFFEEFDFSETIKKINFEFLFIIDILAVVGEFNFSKHISILSEFLDIINIIFDKQKDIYIKMIGYNKNYGVSFEYTLLNPGKYLEDNLYSKLDSLLFTSATLKIGENFDYIKNILSLDDFNFVSFDSDFDYKKQATLFIPNDLGSIKNNSGNIVNFLSDFFQIVKGRTLTLLTSFSMIKKLYTSLNQDLKKDKINLYAQAIGGSKIKLLNFFLDSPNNSILLGTDSFWQGIDIDGEKLKYLVIHKFPFGVPNDPIFQSRAKYFKDPFKDYSIPKAIIKLKQGFGRLIRSKTDSGLIILLDDRILHTSWGKEFYKSFPESINVKTSSSKHFLSILKNK